MLTVLGEPLTLASFGLRNADAVASVFADGAEVLYAVRDGKIAFFDERRIENELVIETV